MLILSISFMYAASDEANLSKKEFLKQKSLSYNEIIKELGAVVINEFDARRVSSNISFKLEQNWNTGKQAYFICYWAWESAPYIFL
ncbi:hypothetical protein [Crassaminicella indica]|uniref:Uncharacterized protein n=1 Tax=Crassaminicella indica TaxID=2855394 RepID=A0ABX8R9M7_9CLOT|nr:hypothetical protein [Crassaminicella indica]QXM05506.1 hypothetical protein KVH43_08970 [Crassaminicella indica]